MLLASVAELRAEMGRIRGRVAELKTSSDRIDLDVAQMRHDHVSVRSALLAVLDDLDRVDKVIETLADRITKEEGPGNA